MEKTPKKNAGKKASELITKCDKLEEPVAICDQLDNEVEIMPIEEIDIAKLIVVVPIHKESFTCFGFFLDLSMRCA